MTYDSDTPADPIPPLRALRLSVSLSTKGNLYLEGDPLVTGSFRIPNDLDDAALDSIAAKVTEQCAAIIGDAIARADSRDLADRMMTTLNALRERAFAPRDHDRRFVGGTGEDATDATDIDVTVTEEVTAEEVTVDNVKG